MSIYPGLEVPPGAPPCTPLVSRGFLESSSDVISTKTEAARERMKNHAAALLYHLRTFSSGHRTVISHDIFDSHRIGSAYLGIQPTSVHVVAFRHNLFLTTGPIFSFRYEAERKCFHIYIFCANFDRRARSSSLPNNIYTHAYIYINSKEKPRGGEGAS